MQNVKVHVRSNEVAATSWHLWRQNCQVMEGAFVQDGEGHISQSAGVGRVNVPCALCLFVCPYHETHKTACSELL